MRRRRPTILGRGGLLAGSVGALVLLVSGAAHAWEPISPERPVWKTFPTYVLHNTGSDDLSFTDSEAQVTSAFSEWANVTCTDLTVTYGGPTGSAPVDGDNINTVGWVESNWNSSSSTIGVTTTFWSTATGEIYEADMRLNGVHYTWVTGSGSFNTVNTYSIVMHEAGHFLGLGHSGDQSATMFGSYSGGIDQLNADDRAGICSLYPGSGGTNDCTVTGCPSGQNCVNGQCVTVSGGDVCEPCTQDSQCGGAGDYCLGYPDGSGYCGRACNSSTDCDAADTCVQISNGETQCARITPTGQPSCGCTSNTDCEPGYYCDVPNATCRPEPTGGFGDNCSENSDCDSNVCEAGKCTTVCNPAVAACPTATWCAPRTADICGEYVCLDGAPGAAAAGGTCTTSADCETGACQNGLCVKRCWSAGDCPSGQQCDSTTGCGICKDSAVTPTGAGLGEECDINNDCASDLCLGDADGSHCSTFCDTGTCPSGYTCQVNNVRNFCMPTIVPPKKAKSGCKCSAGAGFDPTPGLVLVLLLVGLAWRRRRAIG